MDPMRLTARKVASAARRRQREETAAMIERSRDAARAAVDAGACPACGRPLRRNTSMTGWWQCSQFGARAFRADPDQPACGWQGFTE